MFLLSTQDIRCAIGGSATPGCGARWVLLEWCSQDPLGEGNPTKTGVNGGTTRQSTKVAKAARRFPLKGKHTRNEHPPFTYPSHTSTPVLSSSTSGDSRPRFNFPAAARFLHGIPGRRKLSGASRRPRVRKGEAGYGPTSHQEERRKRGPFIRATGARPRCGIETAWRKPSDSLCILLLPAGTDACGNHCGILQNNKSTRWEVPGKAR